MKHAEAELCSLLFCGFVEFKNEKCSHSSSHFSAFNVGLIKTPIKVKVISGPNYNCSLFLVRVRMQPAVLHKIQETSGCAELKQSVHFVV